MFETEDVAQEREERGAVPAGAGPPGLALRHRGAHPGAAGGEIEEELRAGAGPCPGPTPRRQRPLRAGPATPAT